MNLAEVEYLDLDSLERLLVRFGNVKVLAGQAHDAGGVGYNGRHPIKHCVGQARDWFSCARGAAMCW